MYCRKSNIRHSKAYKSCFCEIYLPIYMSTSDLLQVPKSTQFIPFIYFCKELLFISLFLLTVLSSFVSHTSSFLLTVAPL